MLQLARIYLKLARLYPKLARLSNIIGDLGVFYEKTSSVVYQGDKVKVILSSSADGTGLLSTDDIVTIKVTQPNGDEKSYEYNYGYPIYNYVQAQPPLMLRNYSLLEETR